MKLINSGLPGYKGLNVVVAVRALVVYVRSYNDHGVGVMRMNASVPELHRTQENKCM